MSRSDASKPPLGRPPIPPEEVRARHVRVPVNEAEGAALDAWAEREGRPLAELVRDVAVRSARRTVGAPVGNGARKQKKP